MSTRDAITWSDHLPGPVQSGGPTPTDELCAFTSPSSLRVQFTTSARVQVPHFDRFFPVSRVAFGKIEKDRLLQLHQFAGMEFTVRLHCIVQRSGLVLRLRNVAGAAAVLRFRTCRSVSCCTSRAPIAGAGARRFILSLEMRVRQMCL
jgi:hypothetical protein